MNLELRPAVVIFLLISASFALDLLKILKAPMSILATMFVTLFNRGGVEDRRLEAKAKDT